ncbi:ferroxidase fet3 [Sporothrix epigloea]|uniref:Ferroxidase fet3 n=1 Tax=Sporothrix epigloea TaxID=1892477 RepID=A0ABP0DA66_9PEZI
MVRFSAAAVLAFALGAVAKTVSLDFNVSWVIVNPDGLADRKVIGVNGEWPLPIINVDKGDRLIVKMYNGLGDKSTSIHWHGMFQNGTNEMDGASMFTQCPIPPGSSFTYNFTINQNGTYWYHCHTDYCYPDGYRQALLVHDKDAPFAGQYKEEISLTLSDWYHTMMDDLRTEFMSLYNPSGAEPIPDAFLLNDGQNKTFKVEPNTTYLLRIINTGNFIAQYFYIEGHNMTIVEVDGVYTEPAQASMLYVHIAQRYSVLVTTGNNTDANFKIVTAADQDLMDTVPDNVRLNLTSWLVYDENAPMDEASINTLNSDDFQAIAFDDFTLVPADRMPLLPEPDHQVNMTVYMVNLMTGYNYAMLNNITYTAPKVPALYTAISSGDMRTNQVIYGEYTNPIVLKHNDVVEFVLNNADSGTHPFHLHGHNFQVIQREPPLGPDFNDYLNNNLIIGYDPNNHTDFPKIPARRDVIVLPPQGFVVVRFVADNPGVWAFHCHIDWHLASGLSMTFIEAPELIPSRISIPEDHYAVCAAGAVPTAGNAAANTVNLLDLQGQNVQPADIPDGWTTRGIVAMAFTVLSAVLGITSLVYYGLADLKQRPKPASANDSSEGEVATSNSDIAKKG